MAKKSSEDTTVTNPFVGNLNPLNPNETYTTYTPVNQGAKLTDVDIRQIYALGETVNDIKLRIEDTESKLEKTKNATTKKLSTLNTQISSANDDVAIAKEEVKELKQSRSDALQSLALFVGLFTFVSIQFQLFSSAEKIHIVPLSLIFTGSLVFFLSFLAIFIKEATRYFIVLVVAGLIISLVGITLYLNTSRDNSGINPVCTKIKQMISQSAIDNKDGNTQSLRNSYDTLLCAEFVK